MANPAAAKTAARPATAAKTATVTELKAETSPPAAPKKSWLKWAIVAVVLAAAGGVAAWWFLMRPAPGAAAGATTAAPPKAPVYLNLEPFTVNLMEESGDHYLQVGVVYQVASDKILDTAKTYMPVLRNRILMLLSSKRPSEIASPDGKKKLVAELVAAAQESLPGSAGPAPAVLGAYFSAFVIQ